VTRLERKTQPTDTSLFSLAEKEHCRSGCRTTQETFGRLHCRVSIQVWGVRFPTPFPVSFSYISLH